MIASFILLHRRIFMKKRLFSLLFAGILALYALPQTVLAAGSLSNFQKINTYAAGQFADVPAAEWYADEVWLAYEYGLVTARRRIPIHPCRT